MVGLRHIDDIFELESLDSVVELKKPFSSYRKIKKPTLK